MKDGTGGDPFADDPVDTTDSADANDSKNSPDTDDSGPSSERAPTADTVTDSTTTEPTGDDEPGNSLPYYYRRETVKEDRDQVPFFLRGHVQDLEDDFIDDLETRLNASNVYKADAREAALQVVYENYADEVADLLREWGYDR